jgi:hypothetical protein
MTQPSLPDTVFRYEVADVEENQLNGKEAPPFTVEKMSQIINFPALPQI